MHNESVVIVHTGKDGQFADDAARRAVEDSFATELQTAKKIVLYFHGGLDNAAAGNRIAHDLDPVFRSAGSIPIFFVWESGLLEILAHNVTEIADESFFKSVLTAVLKFASAKLTDFGGARAVPGALALPTSMDVALELEKRKSGQEPFDDVIPPSAPVPDLTSAEREMFKQALSGDMTFTTAVEEIDASILPEPMSTVTARGVSSRTQASRKTLLSPDVVEELRRDRTAADQQGARGLLSSALLIRKALTVLVAVIRRFNGHRDHGLYPTVVEEILREFYVANVGGKIWAAMKGETADTFEAADPIRGGQFFIAQLAKLVQAKGPALEITLVGHSTGAVFINNLLKFVLEQRNQGVFPMEFPFKHVILLAPASSFHDFSSYTKDTYYGGPNRLYESLHIFAMADKTECQDVLVPGVYTRSLLYFVSGVLETGPDGKGAVDVPLVGMQRYYVDTATYTDKDVLAVRQFVAGLGAQSVWSPGVTCESLHHGGFASDAATRRAMISIIRGP